MNETQPVVVAAGEGRLGWLGGLGIRFLLEGGAAGGRFSIVEHPLKPRALAAPPHRHANEDEYSFVLRGRVGALLGDDVVFGEVGSLIHKPRGQWHTFWNAGDGDASLLEIISPAGFEHYFEEVLETVVDGRPQLEKIPPIAQRYGLELDPSRIADICREHGLTF